MLIRLEDSNCTLKIVPLFGQKNGRNWLPLAALKHYSCIRNKENILYVRLSCFFKLKSTFYVLVVLVLCPLSCMYV